MSLELFVVRKEKIIYIYPIDSTFVKKDIEFLSKNYNIISPKPEWSTGFLPLVFFKQFFWLLWNIIQAKAIFVMSGGFWSFFPSIFGKITGKPVFIILGGSECVSFPSINYGSLSNPLLKYIIKWSLKFATELLPVSDTLVLCDNTFNEVIDYKKQGYKAFFPNIKTPYTVIHNGFDSTFWQSTNFPKKENTFITVASISNMQRYFVKGINKIFELAPKMPDCTFIIVGVSENMKEKLKNKPFNVIFYNFISPEEFKQIIEETQYYIQLSISEGFPNAVCEGMLCGCIPIVSNVGAMPYIVDKCGLILENNNTDYLFDKIYQFITMDKKEKTNLSLLSRQRVIEKFTIERREKAFNLIINKHLK
jgi:glycosyltransferase involved in cell wall biosynthesis